MLFIIHNNNSKRIKNYKSKKVLLFLKKSNTHSSEIDNHNGKYDFFVLSKKVFFLLYPSSQKYLQWFHIKTKLKTYRKSSLSSFFYSQDRINLSFMVFNLKTVINR